MLLKYLPSADDRALLVQQGSIDVAFGLSASKLNSLRGTDGVLLINAPSRNWNFLGLTNTIAPFNDVRVRQAVAYALPYQVLIQDSLAAAGTLPPVCWIDPAFTNFNPLGFPVNDDHPPADIKDGQDLVLAVYDALASSPVWDRSLLVVVYDENGGFFDHVPPPGAADDDPAMFGSYGVRVPPSVAGCASAKTERYRLRKRTGITKNKAITR